MPTDLQTLIDDFLEALSLRQLARCEEILNRLQEAAQSDPAYRGWPDYLRGILANERDHDWGAAEQIFRQLLRTELSLPLRGRTLLALGRTYDYLGRWTEAIEAYQASLPIFDQLGRPVDRAKSWKQIALAYYAGFMQGDFGPPALQQGLDYCRQALDLLARSAEPVDDEVTWLRGSIWNARGLIYGCLGDWDQAIDCYQRDLEICRALDDRYGIGLSYLNLGEVYHKKGSSYWPHALDAYQYALRITREFKDRYYETETLANLASLYQEMGDRRQALYYYQQAVAVIETLRSGITSEAARAGFFATIVGTYANLILLCLALGRAEEAFDYVERARSRAFLDMLAGRWPEGSARLDAEPMTLAEVQAALPADTLLLACFTTGLIETRSRGRNARRHRFPPARTLIFAVSADGLHVHDSGLSPNDLRPGQLNNVVERHFLQPQIRRVLYDKLIRPLEPLLAGKERLYLAPHGPLHYIPFQALLKPDGQTLLEAAGPRLVYAPSATLFFRYRRQVSGQAPRPSLALGYNGSGETILRFGEEEAHSIARLTGGRTLIGPGGKKEILYQQADQYRLLHLSCHGHFDPGSPLNSALHIAADETLTALDVLTHLRLRCDLVTLSACESGLNRVRRGDELEGLVRAFLYAGAPVLVSTLWRVDERSTRILMEEFYRQINAGRDYASALKQAQLYLKTLTRSEALDKLSHFLADEILHRHSQDASGDDTPAADRALTAILTKSPAAQPPSVSGEEDEKVFADPYYWAPFILVGDADLSY